MGFRYIPASAGPETYGVLGGLRGISGAAGGGSINFDFTTGSLPAAITFTRASIGTYNSSGNILITAGNDVARMNYVSGVANLLIEGSATNLLTQSNSFSNAIWVPGLNPVIAAAQFISPDGTNNGWSMTGGDGNAYIYELQTLSAIPYTMSIWMKQIAGAGALQLLIGGAATSFSINTTLGRYSGTKTSAAGGPTAIIQVLGVAGDKNGMYGVQLETGSVMTSYIPTTTAAVTRSADSAVFTIPAGVNALLYTFDDNSTQLVAVSAGSYTIPVTLNRPNIKSIVGSA